MNYAEVTRRIQTLQIIEEPAFSFTGEPTVVRGPRLTPRQMPLRVLPFNSTIEMTCRHCFLNNTYAVGQLMKDAGYENTSVEELEERLVCKRTTCIGPLTVELVLGD